MEYRPEIIELANKFVESRNDLNLKLEAIKKGHSNTVGDSYTSFGCYKCDSIFGDWYVMEAKIDIMYEPKELTHQGEIELKEVVELLLILLSRLNPGSNGRTKRPIGMTRLSTKRMNC